MTFFLAFVSSPHHVVYTVFFLNSVTQKRKFHSGFSPLYGVTLPLVTPLPISPLFVVPAVGDIRKIWFRFFKA